MRKSLIVTAIAISLTFPLSVWPHPQDELQSPAGESTRCFRYFNENSLWHDFPDIDIEEFSRRQYLFFIAKWSYLEGNSPLAQTLRTKETDWENRLDQMISALTEPEKKDIKKSVRVAEDKLTISGDPHGHGVWGSSTHHELEMEHFWASRFAAVMRDEGLHPLVIPIDEFYQLAPTSLSMVYKVTGLPITLGRNRDSQGRPYVFLLTEFSNSQIFTQDVLDRLPTLTQANYHNHAELSTWKDRASRILSKMFSRLGSSVAVLRYLQEHYGADTFSAKVFMIYLMLSRDVSTWQDLWHDDKPAMVFVAPSSFHSAVNEVNGDCGGHCSLDYQIRSGHSLGYRGWAQFDKQTSLQDSLHATVTVAPIRYEPLHKGQLTVDEFQRHVESILRPLFADPQWEP